METQAPSEQSINLVIDLFEDWKRMFGNKLQDRQHLDLRTAELWALALRNERLTLAEFKQAAALSLSLKWPPTSAADFVALIRTESEYPETYKAYKQAANQDYSHEVIYESAKRVGFWEIRSQAESVTYKRWQKVYPEVCEEHRKGAVFKLPESHQIEHKHIPASPDSSVMQEWEKLKQRMLGKRGKSCEQ